MVSVVSLMSAVSLADVTGEAPPVVGPYTAATGLPVVGDPGEHGRPARPAQPDWPGHPAQPVGPPPMRPSPPPPIVGPPLTPPTGPMPPAVPAGAGSAFGGAGQAASPIPGDVGRREERRDPRREMPQDQPRGKPQRQKQPKRDDRRPGGSAAPPSGPTPIGKARGRRRTGPVLGLAAAAAIVGAVGGGAAVVKTGYFQEKQQVFNEAVAPIAGDTVTATDKKTGAHIEAALTSRPWGTKVEFQVTKIEGPQSCRLVAVRENGETEVLSTWTVPDGGYGYEVRPQPLALEAATALASKDITHLRVQAMDPHGDPSTLVTVRV
jgi:hypothetical protein